MKSTNSNATINSSYNSWNVNEAEKIAVKKLLNRNSLSIQNHKVNNPEAQPIELVTCLDWLIESSHFDVAEALLTKSDDINLKRFMSFKSLLYQKRFAEGIKMVQ